MTAKKLLIGQKVYALASRLIGDGRIVVFGGTLIKKEFDQIITGKSIKQKWIYWVKFEGNKDQSPMTRDALYVRESAAQKAADKRNKELGYV